MYNSLIPRDGLARHQQVSAYFVPLAAVAASCSLNLSCLSILMPRNLCEGTGLISLPAIQMRTLLIGFVFLGLAVDGWHRWDAWTNAVLSISNLTWWVALHSIHPPGHSTMSTSFVLASLNVGALAMNLMSSINPKASFPFCHNCDTQSTLYHSIWLCPHIYHPFHCMYLRFPIISILLVFPLISECSVCPISPYDYLICFHLQFQLPSVPIPLYLLIQYTLGNRSPIPPGLLITLHNCTHHCLLVFPTPQASPHTFYSSI